MNFNWNSVFYAVMSIVTVLGIPSLIVATVWCFMDEHPFIGVLFSLLLLVLIGFVAGLPEEVFS